MLGVVGCRLWTKIFRPHNIIFTDSYTHKLDILVDLNNQYDRNNIQPTTQNISHTL